MSILHIHQPRHLPHPFSLSQSHAPGYPLPPLSCVPYAVSTPTPTLALTPSAVFARKQHIADFVAQAAEEAEALVARARADEAWLLLDREFVRLMKMDGRCGAVRWVAGN